MCFLASRFHKTKPCGALFSSWIYNTLFRATHDKYNEIYMAGGAYFSYLVPEVAEEESSDEAWHGRLIALERSIKSESGKHKKALGGELMTQSQWSVDRRRVVVQRLTRKQRMSFLHCSTE